MKELKPNPDFERERLAWLRELARREAEREHWENEMRHREDAMRELGWID